MLLMMIYAKYGKVLQGRLQFIGKRCGGANVIIQIEV